MITAVIGAQFGDEGKGLVTDYLSTEDTLVVRYNGGAQAGHTVVTHDARHEFHHVGAGTFKGAPTLLSRFFLVNPILFIPEAIKWPDARIFVDRNAPVTTPWDMLINRAAEDARAGKRHGSCGLGVNETVTRTARGGYSLLAGDLFEDDVTVESLLHHIETQWVPLRLRELGITDWIPSDRVREQFLKGVALLREQELCEDWQVLQHWVNDCQLDVVFEGAQGLRLDERADGYPHVTRSRTGLPNICTLLDSSAISDPLRIFYVTRSYVTRHGAGPLPGEVSSHPFGWVGPETNVTNAYQGSLRYAPLIAEDLRLAVTRDLRNTTLGRVTDPYLAMTCVDQTDDSFSPFDVADDIGARLALVSHGPTRDDVECLLRHARVKCAHGAPCRIAG